MSDDALIEVVIHGLTVDAGNNNPVVLLKEVGGKRAVPIWIGVFEANSIAMRLTGLEPPRPMTHDLLHNVITESGYHIEAVTVTELKENTFYATLSLDGKDKLVIDSRPSDAIALAVRAEVPIRVSSDIFESSSIDVSSIEIDEGKRKDKWSELLENLDPEEYSKYKM